MAIPRLVRIIVDSRFALPSRDRRHLDLLEVLQLQLEELTIPTARPAVPAITTAEYSSAGKTFSCHAAR